MMVMLNVIAGNILIWKLNKKLYDFYKSSAFSLLYHSSINIRKGAITWYSV